MKWSASSLRENCGWANILSKDRMPTPEQQRSMDRGTDLHAMAERWIKTREYQTSPDLEIQGWFDVLAQRLTERPASLGGMVEVAWGLSPALKHVHVAEPKPHKYESMDGSEIITAGRTDLVWTTDNGDLRCVFNVDYKSGKWPVTPADRNLQLLAGCIALADRFASDVYVPIVYYARDGVFDWGRGVVVGSEEDAVNRAAVLKSAQLDETPRPGPWCDNCWEKKMKRCEFAQKDAA